MTSTPTPSSSGAADTGSDGQEPDDVGKIEEFFEQAPIAETPYETRNAEQHDRATRRSVTLSLLGLLLVLIVGSVIMLNAQHATAAQTMELTEHFYGPLVALTGTAIGFYFSERIRR